MNEHGFTSEPATPPAAPPTGNGLAIAGLVLGIVAVLLCWVPLVNWVLAILAIVFGAVGMGRARKVGGRGRGMAIVGLVLGILSGVAGTVVVFVLAKRSQEAFGEYMERSRQIEAKLGLNRIGRGAKAFYIETAAFPEGSAPLTPAQSCCEQPQGQCAETPAGWDVAPWNQLDFDPGRSRFRYSYEGTATHFVARAVGDLDCDGNTIEWRVEGTIVDGNPLVEESGPFGVD
ncbi:MAG: DUF4190 domain-containing protein [Kofleriaceae bacterium]